jgi:hypothetical protein
MNPTTTLSVLQSADDVDLSVADSYAVYQLLAGEFFAAQGYLVAWWPFYNVYIAWIRQGGMIVRVPWDLEARYYVARQGKKVWEQPE